MICFPCGSWHWTLRNATADDSSPSPLSSMTSLCSHLSHGRTWGSVNWEVQFKLHFKPTNCEKRSDTDITSQEKREPCCFESLQFFFFSIFIVVMVLLSEVKGFISLKHSTAGGLSPAWPAAAWRWKHSGKRLFAVGSRQVSGCLASEINVPTSCPQTRRRCLWRRPIRTFEREIYVPLGAAGDKSRANVHFQAEPSDRRRVERR